MQSYALPLDELIEPFDANQVLEVFLGGVIDHDSQVVTFIRGNLRKLSVPFDWFKPNPVCSPDFTRFEIIDCGTAVKLGHYEVSVRQVLHDHDPEMRQVYLNRLVEPASPDTRPFSTLIEKLSPEAQAEVKRLSTEIIRSLFSHGVRIEEPHG